MGLGLQHMKLEGAQFSSEQIILLSELYLDFIQLIGGKESWNLIPTLQFSQMRQHSADTVNELGERSLWLKGTSKSIS